MGAKGALNLAGDGRGWTLIGRGKLAAKELKGRKKERRIPCQMRLVP